MTIASRGVIATSSPVVALVSRISAWPRSHVTEAFRAMGIGRRLSEELDLVARDAGDTEMVVSATPSENTVRFYLSRGYELMANHCRSSMNSSPRTCI